MTNNDKQAVDKNRKTEMLADETEYLWSDPANHQHLSQGIESAKNPENLVVISALSWGETYRAIATEQEDWTDFDDALVDGLGHDEFDT